MSDMLPGREAIFQYASDRFGAAPEYLWLDAPEHAVLRRTDNARWFGVILDVPKWRLGLEGDGLIDILDVKCDPILAGSLREMPGFLPAYHMNKNHWVAVRLDGTASMDQICGLLDMSYVLAGGKRRKRR